MAVWQRGGVANVGGRKTEGGWEGFSTQQGTRQGLELFPWLVLVLGLFKDELALKAPGSHRAFLNWTQTLVLCLPTA